MANKPMIFPPLWESFCLRGHVNTSSVSAVHILNDAFDNISINMIGEPKMSTTSLETGLCLLGFVPSVWTKIEIPVLLSLFQSNAMN